MSYTPPAANAVDASWQGQSAYTPPASSAVDASWAPTGAVAQIAGTVAVAGEMLATHTAAPIDEVVCTIAGVVGVVGSAAAFHGVAGVAAGAVLVSGAADAAHGVAGVASGMLAVTGACAAMHLRYELRGEVRVGGVLVNRRVRAYLRDTGALVSQGDTTAGRFALPAGFDAAEHYVVPIDLAPGATDWLPPTANRLVSVLAMDEAAP